MSVSVTVYGLAAPDGVIKYVGQTRRPLETRLRSHRDAAKSGRTWSVYAWMREIGLEKVSAVPLEECSHEDRLERERHWILELKTSTLHGGCNTWVRGEMTGELLEKLRANALAAMQAPGWSRGGGMTGKTHSPESRAVMSSKRAEAHQRKREALLARWREQGFEV